MSRTLYWKAYNPREMVALNKCVPLMDALRGVYGDGEIILGENDIEKLIFLKEALFSEEAFHVCELIELIQKHEKIAVEIRY